MKITVMYKDLTNGLRVELNVYRNTYNLFVIGRNAEIIDRCCGIRFRDDAEAAFDHAGDWRLART